MKKLSCLLIVIILTACATVPQEGNFTASGHYKQNQNGSYDLSDVQITLIPVGITPTPSPTPVSPSPTVVKTPTVVPSATPTVVPPTVTATPVPSNVNLFKNPGFEGGFEIFTWPSGLRLPEVATALNWKPFMCDFPYKTAPCPAKFQGTKNPSNLLMGRPEMRGTEVSNRVNKDRSAQYWFCQFRACDGGVYQTVSTQPGQTCTASVYVQSWSRIEWNSNQTPDYNFTHSTFPNDDAYSNSLWRIVVDPYGGENVDADRVLKSVWYSLPRSIVSIDNQAIDILDHYDKYALISYTFTARGSFATVYFENLRLFPFTFNDSMVDDASLYCSGGVQPTATPVPSSTPISITPANAVYTVIKPVLNVRSSRDYSTDKNIIRTLTVGTKVTVHCVVEEKQEEHWGSESACSSATEWFVLRIGQEDFATTDPSPEGT